MRFYLSTHSKRFGAGTALVLLVALVAGCGGGGSTSSSATLAVRVACVGDSITSGYGTTNPTTDAYPVVLGRWLGGSYQVREFGYGGATLLNSGPVPYQKQNAFRQALKFKPDVLVVTLGTNDRVLTFDSATSANFEKDYKTLIAAFRAANANVKVYTCLPPPSYPLQGQLNATLSTDILPLIRDVASTDNAQIVDFNSALSGQQKFYFDGVHLTTPGAHLLAAEVYKSFTGQPAQS